MEYDLAVKKRTFAGSGIHSREEVETLWEPNVVTDSREAVPSGHNRANGHTDSQRLWKHTHALRRVGPNPSTARGTWAQSPTPLTKKIFAIDMCWERRNQSSLMACTWYISHTPVQTSCVGIVGQHKTHSEIETRAGGERVFCFGTFLSCWVLFVLIFIFFVLFCFEKEKREKKREKLRK